MKNLTDRQREVLDFIAQYSEENYRAPSVRDISDYFGISLRAVQDHIAALQRKGYLSLSERRARSLHVLKDERQKTPAPFTRKVPLIGELHGSKQLLADENITGGITLTEPSVKPEKTYFATHMRGTSMTNAGILEGDMVVFERTDSAEDGQIVAVIIDNNLTVRRFFRDSGRVRLQAENPDFQPIYADSVRIEGKLASSLRFY